MDPLTQDFIYSLTQSTSRRGNCPGFMFRFRWNCCKQNNSSTAKSTTYCSLHSLPSTMFDTFKSATLQSSVITETFGMPNIPTYQYKIVTTSSTSSHVSFMTRSWKVRGAIQDIPKEVNCHNHIYVFKYMCIYIYTHTYVCIYIYIYAHVYIHICIYIYTWLITMWKYTCPDVYVSKYICIHKRTSYVYSQSKELVEIDFTWHQLS